MLWQSYDPKKAMDCTLFSPYFGDLKITSTSTERQKRSQILAPVLVIISGNSLVFSRKIITSTGFYRCCAPGASAPVVVINQSPNIGVWVLGAHQGGHATTRFVGGFLEGCFLEGFLPGGVS